MERIQAAIQKAKEQRGDVEPAAGFGNGAVNGAGHGAVNGGGVGGGFTRGVQRPAQVGPAWAELASFEPEARLLARNHVVTFEDVDPAHTHFDILRTKVLRTMQKNGWTALGITSPTSGCGKTTLALNLAFSLAHQADIRTVLVELDLRRPAMARQLGLKAPQSMASVLQGTRGVAENFVRYGDNLAIGTNSSSVRDSAELLMNVRTAEGVAAIKRAFLPDIVVYDLPPMLQSDDVMAFLPQLDCMLLVAGAEKSRLDEVDKCEKDLAEQTNVLGVVLNSCRYMSEDFGY